MEISGLIIIEKKYWDKKIDLIEKSFHLIQMRWSPRRIRFISLQFFHLCDNKIASH
jgi:hypothetical protein